MITEINMIQYRIWKLSQKRYKRCELGILRREKSQSIWEVKDFHDGIYLRYTLKKMSIISVNFISSKSIFLSSHIFTLIFIQR